jgi:hypothetical protein
MTFIKEEETIKKRVHASEQKQHYLIAVTIKHEWDVDCKILLIHLNFKRTYFIVPIKKIPSIR